MLEVYVPTIEQDFANATLVLVDLSTVDDDLPTVDQVSKMLLRTLSEWLGLLRGVDPGQSDLVLLPDNIEQGDSVAINHTDDLACNLFCIHATTCK